MPITTNDVYSLLGELLHNCQRIEWVMKYLVEQACREIEFKTVEELKEPPKIESKWEQNTDTLGTVIKAYLHGFYDEPVEDDSDGDCIKIQVKYSFNSDADASVRALNCRRRKEECDELVAIRNFLAHQFALKYPLQDEENCALAMAYLECAKTKLHKHIEQLKLEIQMFESVRQRTASLMASPNVPIVFERLRRMSELKGKIGRLKSYDFSNMSSRTIYDYTDRQDILEAILYGNDLVSPESYKSFPLEVRLSHLQCLADISGNPNFKAAIKKQLYKIGVFIPD